MKIALCPFPDCPDPVIHDTYPKTLLRRELDHGWVVLSRKGGGVHAVELPSYSGRLAHVECVKRASRGLTGQQSLT